MLFILKTKGRRLSGLQMWNGKTTVLVWRFIKRIINVAHASSELDENKKKVLRITNILLFFDTTRTVKKTLPPTVLRCRRNVFTEPLPSNDRIHSKYTQTDGWDLWAQVPQYTYHISLRLVQAFRSWLGRYSQTYREHGELMSLLLF
jgi:hypothetical protein